MAEPNLLRESIEVTVNGDTYEFGIPSYMDEIKIGIKERAIRRQIEAELGVSSSDGIDNLDAGTYFLLRTAAMFEVLLRKSSVTWPWSTDDKGAPVVNFSKWPREHTGDVLDVGVAYNAEVARFRNGGVSDGDAPSTEAVEGKSDT